ncbi:MAG TPA: LCP family protein [Acidimicrobiia bacterium]
MSEHSRPSHFWRNLVIGLLVLANLALVGVYWLLHTTQEAFVTSASQVEEVVPELNVRPTNNQDPITFLVIGSDSREGLDDLENFGNFAGARADVIMLLKVYPDSDKAQILSIPRDLLVGIPGHGENRINSAYSLGGAALMVRTVKEVTGLPIHHYVEVDFAGFQAIVDQVDGVYFDFEYPARDKKSGLEVQAGHQLLDGSQALALARSRHYQELRDGRWRSVDGGDIGRTARQQQLILAIIDRIARPSSITEAGDLVTAFASHLTIDATLAQRSIIELAFNMRGIDVSAIETATVPGRAATVEGRSVLKMQEPEAGQLISAFSNGRSLNAEEPLRLQVLNGNGLSGSAGNWSQVLEDKGFAIANIGDASSSEFTTTLVLVPPDHMEYGEAVIDALGFGEVTTGSIEGAVDAVVILGADAGTAAG